MFFVFHLKVSHLWRSFFYRTVRLFLNYLTNFIHRCIPYTKKRNWKKPSVGQGRCIARQYHEVDEFNFPTSSHHFLLWPRYPKKTQVFRPESVKYSLGGFSPRHLDELNGSLFRRFGDGSYLLSFRSSGYSSGDVVVEQGDGVRGTESPYTTEG